MLANGIGNHTPTTARRITGGPFERENIMGVAAYHRGTQVIRHQTDLQIAESQPAIDRRSERERIKELQAVIQDLHRQLARQTSRADKAIKLMNSARTERDRLKKCIPAKAVVARLRESVRGTPMGGRLMRLWTEMIKIEEEA